MKIKIAGGIYSGCVAIYDADKRAPSDKIARFLKVVAGFEDGHLLYGGELHDKVVDHEIWHARLARIYGSEHGDFCRLAVGCDDECYGPLFAGSIFSVFIEEGNLTFFVSRLDEEIVLRALRRPRLKDGTWDMSIPLHDLLQVLKDEVWVPVIADDPLIKLPPDPEEAG